MINNERFLNTLLVTNGLPNNIVGLLQKMNFLDSEFALKNMIKNYKLCFKEKEDNYLSILVDLCMINRHKKELNSCLDYIHGYEMFNTFGTPCYDWGMICKFSQVKELVEHREDICELLRDLKRRIINYIQDIETDGGFSKWDGYEVIKRIGDFMASPIVIDKKERIKINDNYSLAEYDGGMILVNTEYGYDQWVKVGFPIGNVYVSFYNMVLEGFGGLDSLIIRREFYSKIYENLRYCYRSNTKMMEYKHTGNFINGERFIKLKFSD